MFAIKVFKFQVSNWTSSPCESDVNSNRYFNARSRLFSPNSIETTINNWIDDNPTYQIKDIKISTVDVEYHNNGRGNTVELWYTITYEK